MFNTLFGLVFAAIYVSVIVGIVAGIMFLLVQWPPLLFAAGGVGVFCWLSDFHKEMNKND